MIGCLKLPFIRPKIRIEDPTLFFEEHGFKEFDSFMRFEGGERIALQRGRTVTRLELAGRAFYLKRNRFNWVEFIKAVVHWKWPPRSALDEWNSIVAVQRLGIPTVTAVAMGESRAFGLEMASFLITEELYGAESLEKIIEKELRGPLSHAKRIWKYSIIKDVARIARVLHGKAMCHQDFYLGHFFLSGEDTLYLIDLQRLRRWEKIPKRYIIKDLGQLNYSADFVGHISRTDRMRFFLEYLELRSLGSTEKKLARSIAAKTDRIAAHTVKLLKRRRRRREIP